MRQNVMKRTNEMFFIKKAQWGTQWPLLVAILSIYSNDISDEISVSVVDCFPFEILTLWTSITRCGLRMGLVEMWLDGSVAIGERVCDWWEGVWECDWWEGVWECDWWEGVRECDWREGVWECDWWEGVWECYWWEGVWECDWREGMWECDWRGCVRVWLVRGCVRVWLERGYVRVWLERVCESVIE